MNHTFKYLAYIFISFFSINASQAQTEYWNEYFQKTRKGGATYYSKLFYLKKGKQRFYYEKKNNQIARIDSMGKSGKLISTKYFDEEQLSQKIIVDLEKNKSKWFFTYRKDGSLRAKFLRHESYEMLPIYVYNKAGELVYKKESNNDPTYPNGQQFESLRQNHTGPWDAHYENGQKMLSIERAGGENTGTIQAWYPNGQLRFSYEADKIPLVEWHPNGRIAMKADSLLKNGYLGVYKWDTSGVLREKYALQGKSMEGKQIYYYSNGQISAIGQNKQGKRVGIWQFFREQGELLKQVNFNLAEKELRIAEEGPLLFKQIFEKPQEEMLYGGSPSFWEETSWADIEPEVINIDITKRKVGYPQIARDKGIQGESIFRVFVSAEGKTLLYKPLKEIHPILTQAVEKAIRELVWEPAYLNGEAVSYWVNVPFNFRLLN